METYLLDWANLLLRWVHVVTAIAWIGSSFYFVFLDNSLTPPLDAGSRRDGATGELWAVHGGGFYHPVKYAVAPPRLPERLHWFYWESYSTWLSGFALFSLTYLWQAPLYLVDPHIMAWSTPAAVAAALGLLVVFWLLYDMACRTLGQRRHGDAWVGLCVLLLVGVAAWWATHLFAGRAAFLLVGAMLATAMSANVAHWIIPGQRKVVAALQAGQPVDPVHGQRGKQRSVHNTYFTLPVVFAMLSTHYSFLYSHPQRVWILLALMLAGAAIRQFFVLRHGHKLGRHRHPWPYAAVGGLLIVCLVIALQPPAAVPSAHASVVSDAQALAIVQQRCVMCHGASVQSKNIRLDSLAELRRLAPLVHQQAVLTRAMPLNNATGITDAERAQLAQWYASSGTEQ